MPVLRLATFVCDVTPPLGHPLCGGWIEPVRSVDDPLWARGIVLLGSGSPIVLCAVDWCGIRNDAHLRWRQALADAAHTVPENVAVHSVHPHDAPFADTEAERLLESAGGPRSLDLRFFERAVQMTANAVQSALARSVRFTHIGTGQAKVEHVASNRRVIGSDGKIQYWRGSATKDPKARAEPVGLIDPWLKTVSFWDESRPQAALSYYATHPMSYYGRGHVSSDFCGLAREQRQKEDPDVFQVYFTGCAGNIAAGKYNDGSPANRPLLRDRMLTAMRAAWTATRRHRVEGWQWRVQSLKLPPRSETSFGATADQQVLENAAEAKVRRGNAAFQLAWLKRLHRPIDFSCILIGNAAILHLPGEPFIEYQLQAQRISLLCAPCSCSGSRSQSTECNGR
jgi:hypothetical protein